MTILDIRMIAISYDLHALLKTLLIKVQFATIRLTFVKATGQSNELSRLALRLSPSPSLFWWLLLFINQFSSTCTSVVKWPMD